jgi:hypothetical protein
MQSRLTVLTLALYLAFAVTACNKKSDTSNASPSDTSSQAASSSGPATPDNSADNSAGGTGSPMSSAPSNMAGTRKSELKPAPAMAMVVPAGTTLTVRLSQAVGSKISQPGQSFTASLSSPVEVDGKTVIPAGADASGTVVDAKPLGRFKGGAVLQVKLNSITVNGKSQAIDTSAVSRTQTGKGKRTAVLAGGGAGLGALIGGLAGGGKGAAIGALAGAGAGTGGAAFTGNKDIVLPAESVLSFKLDQPLDLK